MKLHNLGSTKGGEVKARKRTGRGCGSGLEHNAGRSRDGQNPRLGRGVRLGSEGGQMPLFRRLPKRSSKNHFIKQYAEINVRDSNCLEDGGEMASEVLANAGFFRPVKVKDGAKILGDGEITKKLTIKANKFTKSTEEKITKAGGKVEVVQDA